MIKVGLNSAGASTARGTLAAAFVCLCLASCSSVVAPLPPATPIVTTAPDPSSKDVLDAIRNTITNDHLPGPQEMTGPIKANPVNSDPWIICVRLGQPGKQRTYAFFFQGNKYISYRWAALIDGCQSQTYQAIPSAPEQTESGKDVDRRHKTRAR